MILDLMAVADALRESHPIPERGDIILELSTDRPDAITIGFTIRGVLFSYEAREHVTFSEIEHGQCDVIKSKAKMMASQINRTLDMGKQGNE